MNDTRRSEVCVLFADICQSTRLFEKLGDRAATPLVHHALSLAANITAQNEGQLIRVKGDDVLCTFESPDQALRSAEQAHSTALVDPELKPHSITFRIGIHWGPVLRVNDEIFGDTVNLAARLVAEAKSRQSLISEAVQNRAGDTFEGRIRKIGQLNLRGKTGTQPVYELLELESTDEITEVTAMRRIRARAFLLQLSYQAKTIRLNPLMNRLLLGRAATCDIVVDEPTVSREHAEITFTNGQFVIRDFSSNGSYVVSDGLPYPLQRSSLQLRGRGTIFLGRTRGSRHLAIDFNCIDSQVR